MVPFVDLSSQMNKILPVIQPRLMNILNKGNFILGEDVPAFEKDFAAFCSTKYAVGVANGTDALMLALKALNLPAESEVIVPANTFISTAFAVVYSGLKIKLIDNHPDTYLMDVDQLENIVSSKTKVILPVHLYGRAVDMTKVMEIAKKYSLYVVEDCAQAHGATHQGKKVGSFGDIGCFSFYPTKNLGCAGDGGGVTTSSAELYERLLKLRNLGQKNKNQHEMVGYNSRLDTLQAVVLQEKLKSLDEWNSERFKAAMDYNMLLEGVGDIQLPRIPQAGEHVFHLYVIRTKRREELSLFLNEKKIGNAVHYPIPIHRHQCFNYLNLEKNSGPLKVAENYAGEILSLPIYSGMKRNEIEEVTNAVKSFFI